MNSCLSVLVADDEPIIRRKVCMMLGDKFHVRQAGTARAARDAAETGCDAMLLDIMFPDGNGIDVCREIKERNPHSTVVISSSMESVDAWNDAFQAGADGYVEKRELLGLHPRKLALMITNLVERNRLRRQAEELNRRQAELLSVLSHDVRAPFQALLGTIQLLRKSQIPEEAAANVETLHQCARDQLAFINSLLELLTLESGQAGLRLVELDINLAVNQAAQRLRVLAEEKGITLGLDLQPDIVQIQGDLGRISQVINNLLTNAIKFTPPGGTITVTTRSAIIRGVKAVELAVQDTGIGIDKKLREKIFQRFHRGREFGTRGERGAGLGLSICREIMHLHGGTIEVDPEVSEGSRLVARFPVRPPEDGATCQRDFEIAAPETCLDRTRATRSRGGSIDER